MTIEELPNPGGASGGGHQPDGALWTTTVLTLGAGVVLGVVVMLAIGPQAAPVPSAPPSSSPVAQASPSTRPSFATAFPQPIFPRHLDPSVRQSLVVDGVGLSFSVPADGWAGFDALYISKNITGSQGAEAMLFWARFPAGQYARACDQPDARWLDGATAATAAELATALATQLPGTEVIAGPTDVEVGGLPATQLSLFVRDDRGCGPGFFYTWDGEDKRLGALWGGNLLGDTITVWVVEALGQPFVIVAGTHLNAGADLEAEVLQVVDSIRFDPEPALPKVAYAETLAAGTRHQISVDGVTFSFSAPAAEWTRYENLYLSKDIIGSQGAEAMVAWTRLPDGQYARACDWDGVRLAGDTAVDLAASLSTSVPGTELVDGPRNVTVGGAAAMLIELHVSDLSPCGRGYFFTWRDAMGGPFWGPPGERDVILVWVFDFGAQPFIIAAESHGNSLNSEVQQIVDSIEFL